MLAGSGLSEFSFFCTEEAHWPFFEWEEQSVTDPDPEIAFWARVGEIVNAYEPDVRRTLDLSYSGKRSNFSFVWHFQRWDNLVLNPGTKESLTVLRIHLDAESAPSLLFFAR